MNFQIKRATSEQHFAACTKQFFCHCLRQPLSAKTCTTFLPFLSWPRDIICLRYPGVCDATTPADRSISAQSSNSSCKPSYLLIGFNCLPILTPKLPRGLYWLLFCLMRSTNGLELCMHQTSAGVCRMRIPQSRCAGKQSGRSTVSSRMPYLPRSTMRWPFLVLVQTCLLA